MKSRLKFLVLCLAATFTGLLSGCSLDIANPNQPSDIEVLATRDGIIALTVGIQQTFMVQCMESALIVPGASAREITADFDQVPVRELEEGGSALPNTNLRVGEFWTRMYKVIAMCDQATTSIPTAIPVGGTRSGMQALVYTYKAMCLGILAQNFEQAALSSGTRATPSLFVPRTQVYAEALRLLGEANNILTSTPASADFTNNVLVKGFNLQNTIRILRARYALFAGQNADAVTFANAVDVTAAGKSEFRFDTGLNPNPVYNIVTLGNFWIARRYYGFDIASGLVDTSDARLATFVTVRDKNSLLYDLQVATFKSFYGALDGTIPVFRQGEVALIRAEANARQNKLDEAITDINAVRTKKGTADYFAIGANLAAYSGAKTQDAVLLEVYRQRSAELYMSGLRLEDARRFGRPAPTSGKLSKGDAQLLKIERTRNFYPYPQTERDNNLNTPPDPAL